VRRWHLLYTTLPLAIACADSTVRMLEPNVTVMVQRDTVRATRSSAPGAFRLSYDLTIPVAIHNADSRVVTLTGSESVEVRTGSGWETASVPIMWALSGGPWGTIIQPGGTLETQINLSIETQLGASPPVASGAALGIYRVSVGVVAEGQSGDIPRVGSNAFVLVAP
jgi:hypothetical protein